MFYRSFYTSKIFALVILPILGLCKPIFAAYPLINELDIANHHLQFWWKNGQFMTGSKESNSCIFPFESEYYPPTPQTIPKDIEKWKELGVDCQPLPMKLNFKESNTLYTVEVQRSFSSNSDLYSDNNDTELKSTLPHISFYREGILMAENLIPRPVVPCSLDLLQIDEKRGNEILVTWRLGETLRGITIFSIPESAK